MISSMLLVMGPLFIGYLIVIKESMWLGKINQATAFLIHLILFLMGLSLSHLDNLSANLQIILRYTAVFFVSMTLCNLAVLPWLDKYSPLTIRSGKAQLALSQMAFQSVKLIMIVATGLVIGLLLPFDFSWVSKASEHTLSLLLLFIGIQLRTSGLSLREIILNKHGMIISLLMWLTCWLGGVISAWVLDMPLSQALAMASGFGWYSLSGILISEAYGPVFGGSSFLIELLRELGALIMIPMLISRKPCTTIGYAGATAMDFTLPLIQSTGGVRCVPVAIVSGFVLSILVPILMLCFISFAR